jgi:recombination protein RecT
MSDAATTAPPPVKEKSKALVIRETIQGMTPEFKAALPAHIAPERFVRTTLTAINLNPDILNCEPRSVYAACMKAAADGLILDGREAALAKFNTKMKVDGVEKWVNVAQYMPMAQGLLKKARNSGEISSIVARVVYSNDKFHFICGDDEKLTHEPCLDSEPGKPRLAYMVARLKDGGIVRHVMTRTEIEKRKAVARSTNIWDKWEAEMWVKTVLRAGAKFLPASSDKPDGGDTIQELVSRDDDLYDLDGADLLGAAEPQAEQQPQRERKPRAGRTAGAKMNGHAAGDQGGQTDLVEHADADGVVSMVTAAERDRFIAEAAKPAAAPAPAATTAAPAAQVQEPAPAPASTPATPAPAPQTAKPAVQDELEIPTNLRRAQPAAAVNEANPPPPSDDDVI